MSNYKISVKNPKSDNYIKIEGYIKFIETDSEITTDSILNNLPNPFINPNTNLPVENNTGNIAYKSLPFVITTSKNILLDDVINNLQLMITIKYGINIELKYESIIETQTQTQNTNLEASNSTNTQIMDPREYIFDVKVRDTFYNTDIGYLTIINKLNDEFIYTNEDLDVIDSEYLEESFVGEEEFLITLEAVNVEALNEAKEFNPENPDPVISTDNVSPYPIPKDKQANINSIVSAMNRKKITNKFTQAAILAIVSKESSFIPRNEGSYAKTSATRIKSIFSKFRKYSDSEVDRIKKNPKEFFDIIYGGKYGNAPDEGFKYRGRGFNQLTFKAGYLEAQNKTGHRLVSDPDLLNTIDVASDCIVVYFLERFPLPSNLRSQYNNMSGGINDFKTLNDAVGAIYHANAGYGNSYSLLVADSTGGRRKAFNTAPSLYNNLA